MLHCAGEGTGAQMVALSGWTFVRFPCVLPIVLSSQEQAISRGPKLRYLPGAMKIAACVNQCGKQLPKNPAFHRALCSPVFCWNVLLCLSFTFPPFDKDVASEKGFCTCKCLQVGSESRLYHWVPVEQASALKIVITTICYQLSCMWMGQGLWEFSENPGLLLCVRDIPTVVCWLNWETKQAWGSHLGTRPSHASLCIFSCTHSIQPVMDLDDSFWYLRVNIACGFLWLHWLKGKRERHSLKPSEQFGINGLWRQLLLGKQSRRLRLNRSCKPERLFVGFW